MSMNDAELFAVKANVDLEKVKGDIVNQTLSKLNGSGVKKGKHTNGTFSAMSETFNFSQSILSAVYEGKGTIIDYSR